MARVEVATNLDSSTLVGRGSAQVVDEVFEWVDDVECSGESEDRKGERKMAKADLVVIAVIESVVEAVVNTMVKPSADVAICNESSGRNGRENDGKTKCRCGNM